jgi:hypothetical protein
LDQVASEEKAETVKKGFFVKAESGEGDVAGNLEEASENIAAIIMFLDIIHRLVFCLKCCPVYISKQTFRKLDSISILR